MFPSLFKACDVTVGEFGIRCDDALAACLSSCAICVDFSNPRGAGTHRHFGSEDVRFWNLWTAL